jgi:hypothetical protein
MVIDNARRDAANSSYRAFSTQSWTGLIVLHLTYIFQATGEGGFKATFFIMVLPDDRKGGD